MSVLNAAPQIVCATLASSGDSGRGLLRRRAPMPEYDARRSPCAQDTHALAESTGFRSSPKSIICFWAQRLRLLWHCFCYLLEAILAVFETFPRLRLVDRPIALEGLGVTPRHEAHHLKWTDLQPLHTSRRPIRRCGGGDSAPSWQVNSDFSSCLSNTPLLVYWRRNNVYLVWRVTISLGGDKMAEEGFSIGKVLRSIAVLVALVVVIGLLSGCDTQSSSRSTTTTPSRTTTASQTTRASDGSRRIDGSSWFGCMNQGDYSDLVTYAVQGDSAAFSQAVALGLVLGTTTRFTDGEKVFLMETKVFSGLVRIRREGETTGYWTSMEALD